MNKVIVQNPNLENSEDSEDSEERIKEQMGGFDSIQNIIKEMCQDMQKDNPNIHNQLGGLIKKLEEQADITKKIIGGRIKGTRLSSFTDEEKEENPSIQNKFTKKEIAERLENYSRISIDDIFDMPKGIWLRYFNKNPNGSPLYRTGGFVIHKDPERRYITLISRPSNITWNMQIETVYSVYAQAKHVKSFQMKKMDTKYKLLSGTANMLDKWFKTDVGMLSKMQSDDKDVIYIVYNKAHNKLYVPVRKQTNQKMIESLDIKEEIFKKQLLNGIKNQLENPISDIYIVGLLNKSDLPKLKKMKSRIKN